MGVWANVRRVIGVFYRGPSPGAQPTAPFPWIMAFRWALIPAYVLYVLTGNVRDESVALMTVLPLLAVYTAATHWRFRAASDDAARLRTWARVLFTDIALVAASLAFNEQELSPVSLLLVALLAQASSMFQPRYVLSLAGWAAVGVFAADIAGDVTSGDIDLAHSAWEAVLLVIVGAFLAHLSGQNRGQPGEPPRGARGGP